MTGAPRIETVGLVGAGRIASVHARHLRAVGVPNLAVHDADPARAEAFAGVHGAAVHPTLDALIEGSDLVAVLAPNGLHRGIAERAIAAGRPVFIEKPVALDLADAEALAEAEAGGAFVAVGHVARFFPGYAEARDLAASGALGRLAVLRTRRVGGFPGKIAPWYGDHARSGGVFVDLAIHDFDWLLWTAGPAARVHARSVGARTGSGPDHGLATVTMVSGALAHVEASWMDPGSFRTAFEIAGSDGLVEWDSRDAASVRSGVGSEARAELPLAPADDPYARQWRAILASLAGGAPPPVGARDATAALRLALAALESARRGTVVELG